MIGNIDFSLYCSPTTAYGNVVGEIYVDESIQKGDEIPLLTTSELEWFSGKFKVRSVHLSGETGQLLIELEDVVAPTEESAAILVEKLQVEAGFFFDAYELP